MTEGAENTTVTEPRKFGLGASRSSRSWSWAGGEVERVECESALLPALRQGLVAALALMLLSVVVTLAAVAAIELGSLHLALPLPGGMLSTGRRISVLPWGRALALWAFALALTGLAFAPLGFLDRRARSVTPSLRCAAMAGVASYVLAFVVVVVIVVQSYYAERVLRFWSVGRGFRDTALALDWQWTTGGLTERLALLAVALLPMLPVSIARVHGAPPAGLLCLACVFAMDEGVVVGWAFKHDPNLSPWFLHSLVWGLFVLAFHLSEVAERRIFPRGRTA